MRICAAALQGGTEQQDAKRAGSVVRVPGESGLWRAESWEWRESGIELELIRMPRGPARVSPGDPGIIVPAPDPAITPTLLAAFELPADGPGSGGRQIHVAASSASAGWRGAALYHESGGAIVPIAASAMRRSVMGQAVAPLGASRAMVFDADAKLEVQLVSADFALDSTTIAGLTNGANRALLGGEVLQFADASHLGSGRWMLRGLLRGRAGTEDAAMTGHEAGARFVLLDDALVTLDPQALGIPEGGQIVAIGIADEDPPTVPIANDGLSLRPPAPVHPRVMHGADGSLMLRWTRRARGAWTWQDAEVPLNEQRERYWVELGSADSPGMRWEADAPALDIPAALMAQLAVSHAGQPLFVRQIGSFAASRPLFLTTIP